MTISCDKRADVRISPRVYTLEIEIEDVENTLSREVIEAIITEKGMQPFLECFEVEEFRQIEKYIKENL